MNLFREGFFSILVIFLGWKANQNQLLKRTTFYKSYINENDINA